MKARRPPANDGACLVSDGRDVTPDGTARAFCISRARPRTSDFAAGGPDFRVVMRFWPGSGVAPAAGQPCSENRRVIFPLGAHCCVFRKSMTCGTDFALRD